MNEVSAKSTPKKIYVRGSVCRLCGGGNESRHMLRVLSKTDLEKNLPSKVHYACGIIINDGDCLTKLICRKCEAFIHKVCDFKQQGECRKQVREFAFLVGILVRQSI